MLRPPDLLLTTYLDRTSTVLEKALASINDFSRFNKGDLGEIASILKQHRLFEWPQFRAFLLSIQTNAYKEVQGLEQQNLNLQQRVELLEHQLQQVEDAEMSRESPPQVQVPVAEMSPIPSDGIILERTRMQLEDAEEALRVSQNQCAQLRRSNAQSEARCISTTTELLQLVGKLSDDCSLLYALLLHLRDSGAAAIVDSPSGCKPLKGAAEPLDEGLTGHLMAARLVGGGKAGAAPGPSSDLVAIWPLLAQALREGAEIINVLPTVPRPMYLNHLLQTTSPPPASPPFLAEPPAALTLDTPASPAQPQAPRPNGLNPPDRHLPRRSPAQGVAPGMRVRNLRICPTTMRTISTTDLHALLVSPSGGALMMLGAAAPGMGPTTPPPVIHPSASVPYIPTATAIPTPVAASSPATPILGGPQHHQQRRSLMSRSRSNMLPPLGRAPVPSPLQQSPRAFSPTTTITTQPQGGTLLASLAGSMSPHSPRHPAGTSLSPGPGRSGYSPGPAAHGGYLPIPPHTPTLTMPAGSILSQIALPAAAGAPRVSTTTSCPPAHTTSPPLLVMTTAAVTRQSSASALMPAPPPSPSPPPCPSAPPGLGVPPARLTGGWRGGRARLPPLDLRLLGRRACDEPE
ncbi:hypothetical protein PAPYR_10007 [Paratrimastix pyriformis]|uniref:Uncharacterized protein n=1 Tax=Paratrimastix pyriformis TaxID=342808 RepID=A0ABQ8UCP8_9EUKA|nr:hypothetical protein PAPYR_10007 [Paratrimastix pyriformis]